MGRRQLDGRSGGARPAWLADVSIYEVHLGSWRRTLDGQPLSYRDLATQLADHVHDLGFTHVELLPIAEHPYEPSWGYQVSGYFAPTSRYGSPDDFRWFVDHLHQRGIGVIVDWVPAHFPKDDWALARFDGTALYEHADPRRAEHPDWGTLEFDYTKPQVRNFLVANALYWLQELHVDGLRVDAVASMLYLDYSRGAGEWSPNTEGGNEDLDAVAFLQQLNTVVHGECPGVLTIAEESTAWEGVTRPVHHGGLGFTHKWNMGWMHDTLAFWAADPLYRRWHHNQVTFGLAYAWAEHFVLPLSHDEVVHLKRPLFGKMPGGLEDEHFANLRALYAWMWAHPGRQLFFMGGELAERSEWSHERSTRLGPVARPPAPRACRRWWAPSTPCRPSTPRCTPPTATRSASVGSRSTTTSAACSPSSARSRGATTWWCAWPTCPVCPATGTASASAAPGRWRAALTTDDGRFGGHGGWHDAIEAEPIPWQGCDHSAVVTHAPARRCSTWCPIERSGREGRGRPSWSTATSTNRPGRTRGRARCPSSRGRRRSTTGTSASRPSATARSARCPSTVVP